MIIHIVMVEPEIPQNTRKYSKNMCNNRSKIALSTSTWI